MATQNPIEQEGTYPLPEAQVDRFMFKVLVDYPSEEHELAILQSMSRMKKDDAITPVVTSKDILDARKTVDIIHIAENIQKYIVSIVLATRNPGKYNLKDLSQLILYGASPRASIYMAIASKALAFTKHRAYVIPEDVRDVGRAILRHRILLTYEAEAEEITTEEIITQIFESIPTP
jgi:MoxR-like ATPase